MHSAKINLKERNHYKRLVNYAEMEVIKQKTSTEGRNTILCTRHEFQLSLAIRILPNREGSLVVLSGRYGKKVEAVCFLTVLYSSV
jgi:hypothetical protein